MSKQAQRRKINNIIFDFDGTIADSFSIFVETIQELLKLPDQLSQSEINDLRGSSTPEIIQKLGVKKWQVPRLVLKGRREIAEKMPQVEIFDGIAEVIGELTTQNYHLYILSTNSKEAIVNFLKRYNLDSSIAKIYAGTSLFGKAKRLKRLLELEDLLARDCVYVGDETRDVEAAREIGLKCIAVGWGYSTPASLKSYSPDKLVATPAVLTGAIDSLKV